MPRLLGPLMTLAEANSLSSEAFVEAFRDIAEHSPWVAERASSLRPFASRATLVDAFQRALATASRLEQEAVLRAHPDLGRKAKLARDSAREQTGAGLDRLTPSELARFEALNEGYRARFGFPFILAVKGADKHRILDAFEQRAGGAHEEEIWTALAQVMRIIRFRIEERVDG
jgi:2-oxo-4-hydroxy-4-carboxy-5-ureidoimidazoline decarboxylase